VCNEAGLDVDYIPKGYTCVLQPVDVGFNSPLKKWIKDYHHEWCLEKYPSLTQHQKIPLPTNDEIMNWVHRAYAQISQQSIINTFKHIGYSIQGMPKNINLTETDLETVSDVTADTGFTDDNSDVIDYRDIFLRRVSNNVDYDVDDDDSENESEDDNNDDNNDDKNN
jgi:hypothetical protein